MGWEIIRTIGVHGGDGLHTTWDVFGELSFEHFLLFSEIDVEGAVVFFIHYVEW